MPLVTGIDHVDVDGCPIAFEELGDTTRQTVLLIHGGAAHSGWWSRVAPRLAEEHHVVLMELSGHGVSGHRDDYGSAQWAREIATVLARTTDAPAALVGHSMGGAVAASAAAEFPDLVDALVLLDTRLPLRDLPRPKSTFRLFGSADEALDRFRLQPEQTCAEPELLRELALRGLVQVPGGWRWRFDPNARRRLTDVGVSAALQAVACPIGYAFGAESEMGGVTSHARLEQVVGRRVPMVSVPRAYHHVPLDQPAGCADVLLELLPIGGSR